VSHGDYPLELLILRTTQFTGYYLPYGWWLQGYLWKITEFVVEQLTKSFIWPIHTTH